MSSSKPFANREQKSNTKSKRNTPNQRVSPYNIRSKKGFTSPKTRRITDYFSSNLNIKSPNEDLQPRLGTPKRKRDGADGDKNDTSLQNAGSPVEKQISMTCGDTRRLRDRSHQSKIGNRLQEKRNENASTKNKRSSTSKKSAKVDVKVQNRPKTKTKRQNYDMNNILGNDGIVGTNKSHNSIFSIIIRRIDRDDKTTEDGMSNRSSYLLKETDINGFDLQNALNNIDEKYKISPTLSRFTSNVRKDTSVLTNSIRSYGTRSLSKSTSPKTKTQCSDVNERLSKKTPAKPKRKLDFGDNDGSNFQKTSSLPLVIKEAENIGGRVTREFHQKMNNSSKKYGVEVLMSGDNLNNTKSNCDYKKPPSKYTRSFSVPSDLHTSIPMSPTRSHGTQFRSKSTNPKMTCLGNNTSLETTQQLNFNYDKGNVDGSDSQESELPQSSSELKDLIQTSPPRFHRTRSQSKRTIPNTTTQHSDTRNNLGNNTSVRTRRKLDFNHNNKRNVDGQDFKEPLSKSPRSSSDLKDSIQTKSTRSHGTRSRSKFTSPKVTTQGSDTQKNAGNNTPIKTRRKLDFNHGNKKETGSSSKTGTSSLSPVTNTGKRITRKSRKKIDSSSKHSDGDEDNEEADLVSTTRSRRKSNITQDKKGNTDHISQKGSKLGENPTSKIYNAFQKYGIHMPSYKDILRDKENCDNYSNLVNDLTELITPLPEIRTNALEIEAPKIEVLNCKHMSKETIKSALKSNLGYLSDIREERVYCERHQKYNKLVFRDELTYNTSMIVFTNEQKQLLVTKLCKYYGNDPLCSDYYFKVLLPELCLKIFMDEYSMTREEATNYLDCYPVEI